MTDHNLDGIPQTSTSRPTPTGQRDVGPSVAPAGEEPRGTHDPMLDGIQRYGIETFAMRDRPDDDVMVADDTDGEYVLFSDIPALISRVREDEREKWEPMVQALTDELLAKPQPDASMGAQYLAGVAVGQRDEREACIAAVRDTPTDPRWNVMQVERAFIAAIRARGEKP